MGADFTDHPLVYLGFRPASSVPLPPDRLPLHGVLHTTSVSSTVPGDLEILPWLAPFSRIIGGPEDPHTDELAVGVGLQQEDSRGRLSLTAVDPARQPRLEYRYLTEPADRTRVGNRNIEESVVLRRTCTAGRRE